MGRSSRKNQWPTADPMTPLLKTSHKEEQLLIDFLKHALNPPFLPCGFELLPIWSTKRGNLLLELGKLKESKPSVFSDIVNAHSESIDRSEKIASGISEMAGKLMDRIESSLGTVRSSRKRLKTYLTESTETSGGFSWKI